MYNNAFYNPQVSLDRINAQISELEKLRSQVQQIPNQMQQPSINQTFQLTPNNQNSIKYVNSVEEVQKELVFADSVFLNKDMNVMWLKNAKGEIKAYGLTEIIEKDQKDLIIEDLMAQIQELKGVNNERDRTNVENEKPTNVQPIRTNKKKQH